MHHLLFQGKLKYGASSKKRRALKSAGSTRPRSPIPGAADALGEEKNNLRRPLDCGRTPTVPRQAHHAAAAGDCEAGAGARGARALSGGGCVAVGPGRTFDIASRPWLLPGVVKYAEQTAAKKVLDRVMSKARLADPAKRPTFDAMLAEVERHIM